MYRFLFFVFSETLLIEPYSRWEDWYSTPSTPPLFWSVTLFIPTDSVITTVPFVLDDPERSRVLILDLLALHMIRTNQGSSTIISYHPPSQWTATTAKSLHSRVYLAGQSIYWQNIFKKVNDPTFVLLATLWYALYAWDEAFEILWEYICQLVRWCCLLGGSCLGWFDT